MLEHKHLIIKAEAKNPPSSEFDAISWMERLVRSINMKIMMGPFAAYSTIPGNKGLTVAAIIETSHIVMHTWDEQDPAMLQLDVYTCSSLDIEKVFDAIAEFGVAHMDYMLFDREYNLVQLA